MGLEKRELDLVRAFELVERAFVGLRVLSLAKARMRNNEAQVKLLVQAVTERRHRCRRPLVDIREERLEHRTGCNRRRTTGGALHR